MTMEIIYVAGVLGSAAIGLFVPPRWKRFLFFGIVLFLAFDWYGLIIYTIGSAISVADDYYITNPYLEIRPIIWGKVPESLVVASVLIEVVLVIISLAYKTISFLT